MPDWVGDSAFYGAAIAAAAITYFWRALGVALSGHLRHDGPLLNWVACIAYALLAGLIARMIVLPIGPLAETTMIARLSGAGMAALAFFLLRRNILAAVAIGATGLVLMNRFVAF
ncbi:AzlD domain-containing protein [Fodinicurvata sp. EGI_FJ10296]|uniref:AzlD domain-containing protein n=1 Tax=Fodinicurvata sp. EGI_FJ10296 TaxID=3231908 RepID=UPI003453D423